MLRVLSIYPNLAILSQSVDSERPLWGQKSAPSFGKLQTQNSVTTDPPGSAKEQAAGLDVCKNESTKKYRLKRTSTCIFCVI